MVNIINSNQTRYLAYHNLGINKLNDLIQRLVQNFSLLPVIGVEIEFYIIDFFDIKSLEKIIGYNIKSEKGNNQYEINIIESSDIKNVINVVNSLKINIIKYLEARGGKVFFSAKPFKDDYGNGMHIHISLINRLNDDLFFNNEKSLLNAMHAICFFTKDFLDVFLNNDGHWLRVNSYKMNPTNISIGKDNRTTMLRIPSKGVKRIEHRLPSPDNNIISCIYYILYSVFVSLEKDFISGSKYRIIYGNAFDKQYDDYCDFFVK